MPTVLVTGFILLRGTHRFFPSGGRSHHQYLLSLSI